MVDESGGFLGRWARRKTDVLQGKPLVEAVAEPAVVATRVVPEPAANAVEPVQQAVAPELPALCLDDVKLLTKDSDFKPFMAQNVGASVRNAAMKKLFSDPHFNVMDGLDIYIDDYSKSDPIPEAMLRQMNSSQFLKLFDEVEDADENKKKDALAWENTNKPADQGAAQPAEPAVTAEQHPASQINPSQPESVPEGLDAMASPKDHDHSDLRL